MLLQIYYTQISILNVMCDVSVDIQSDHLNQMSMGGDPLQDTFDNYHQLLSKILHNLFQTITNVFFIELLT